MDARRKSPNSLNSALCRGLCWVNCRRALLSGSSGPRIKDALADAKSASKRVKHRRSRALREWEKKTGHPPSSVTMVAPKTEGWLPY